MFVDGHKIIYEYVNKYSYFIRLPTSVKMKSPLVALISEQYI